MNGLNEQGKEKKKEKRRGKKRKETTFFRALPEERNIYIYI